VVVDASEFSDAMTINSIEFFLAPGAAHNEVEFDEFYVYMGYCATDELAANYNSNYINGWKYKVFESTTPITFHDTDPTIYFDTPFFYQPSQGNLVFEIIWPNGKNEFWVYNDVQDKTTLVHGGYDLEAGDQYMERPHLLIHGDLALEQTTFAGIKASFQ